MEIIVASMNLWVGAEDAFWRIVLVVEREEMHLRS